MKLAIILLSNLLDIEPAQANVLYALSDWAGNKIIYHSELMVLVNFYGLNTDDLFTNIEKLVNKKYMKIHTYSEDDYRIEAYQLTVFKTPVNDLFDLTKSVAVT